MMGAYGLWEEGGGGGRGTCTAGIEASYGASLQRAISPVVPLWCLSFAADSEVEVTRQRDSA